MDNNNNKRQAGGGRGGKWINKKTNKWVEKINKTKKMSGK